MAYRKFTPEEERAAVLRRIETHTIPEPTSGCHLWDGNLHNGYAYTFVWEDGIIRKRKVTRVLWELAYGPIPKGLLLCHSCDNPSCVNLKHIFIGTQTDNMRDAKRKGRHWVDTGIYQAGGGANCPRAKLTAAQVGQIRTSIQEGCKVRSLAARFGVDRSTIYNIIHHRTWRNYAESNAS